MLQFSPGTGDAPDGQIQRIAILEKYVAYLSGYVQGLAENAEKEVLSLRQRVSILEASIVKPAIKAAMEDNNG